MSEPTAEQLAAWDAWLADRPECIRQAVRHLPPWNDYRIRSTGQRARIYSYSEPGETSGVTITAFVWREELPELTSRTVFGFSPDDFEVWPVTRSAGRTP